MRLLRLSDGVSVAEKFAALLEDQAQLQEVLRQGNERAGAVAAATLRDVYERVGFVAPGR